ncbi:LysR family transcriptional regulator [Starkeya sp. ORNL1]|uniref:LysR family transcriptional regulator n=1 Tax=Starkeya sp. ORNL1 TaxID=2709380 RepID=UPI001463B13D|nr:LysR family transcriptional regulator [Starkeya sp. ORNL1]QJP15802.1 LysR family transcriptional regulator [Starkeya sp. ORNL1]
MKLALRHIEAFLAVAEHGNFSTASRHLHVAQPALSQAVKDLEAELGVRLFDRTTRRVELTAAGLEFQGSTSKILEDLEHAVENVRDLATRRRGRIRVAAPPLLSSVILPQAIAAFHRDYPGVAIELIDIGTEEIVASVVTGKADCGLGTFSPSEEGIERTLLMRDNLMMFCSPEHPAHDLTTVAWSELRDQPLIALTRTSGIRLLMDIGIESAGISAKPAFEVSLITTALALVEADLGVSVLPSYALAAARHYAVIARPLVDPVISRDVVLIHASGRSISPAVATFSGVLRSYAQKLTPAQGVAENSSRKPRTTSS